SWRIRDGGDVWQIVFQLRPGVKFSTGRPVTAKAVAFSFDRVIALNKSPAFLFKDIGGMKEGDTIAVGSDTVVVSLPKTSSPQAFLSVLTFTVGAIVDPDEAMAHQSGSDRGEAWLRNHSAGTGPYMLDLASKPGVMSQDGKLLQLVYVGMNVKQPPLDNVKVREAVRWSIDYDGIIRSLLRGGARKVQTIVPEGLFGFNSSAPFQQDISKAKALLAEAGVGGGFTVEMLVPTGPAPGGPKWADIAAKIQSDLAKAGIKVELTDKVLHEGPYIVLYQPTKRFGLRQNVQGFVWNPMAYAEFRTVSK